MADYSDLAQIEALYAEQAQIDQALTILDDYEGTVRNVTVAATASVPDTPTPLPVMIVMADPSQAMISGVRAGLIQRYNEINHELRDLGVTGTPPDHQGGGPPMVETRPV